jgi:thiol-disulfide isomerase/thioredoxin
MRMRAVYTLFVATMFPVALLAVAGCDRKQEPTHIAGDPTSAMAPPGTASAAVVAPGPAASPVVAEPPAAANGVVRDGAGKLKIVRAPTDAEVASFVRTERLRAKAEGRVLVVYAGARWCEPCKHFHALAYSGKLDSKLSRTELLEFDVDSDTERLSGAGYTYKFIPYFALAGADGHPSRELAVKTQSMTDSAVDELAAFQE